MIRITGQVVAVREKAATIELSNGETKDVFIKHPLKYGEIVNVVYNTNTHTILYIIPEGGGDVDDDSYNEIEEIIYDKTFYED